MTKLLGIWISEDMSWSRNCKEISMKALSRLSMITKLKYLGVGKEDLLDIYILFIRSVTEHQIRKDPKNVLESDLRGQLCVLSICFKGL